MSEVTGMKVQEKIEIVIGNARKRKTEVELKCLGQKFSIRYSNDNFVVSGRKGILIFDVGELFNFLKKKFEENQECRLSKNREEFYNKVVV